MIALIRDCRDFGGQGGSVTSSLVSRSVPGVMQRERDTLMLQLMHDVTSRDLNIPTLIDPRSGREKREKCEHGAERGGGGGGGADSWSRGQGGTGAMQTSERSQERTAEGRAV